MIHPGITWICILASVVTLAPVVLYLLRIRHDPFHPFIYMGCMCFGLITYKTFQDQEQLIEHLDPSDIIMFSVILILSVLGYYVGWWVARRRMMRVGLSPVAWEYDASKLLVFGTLFSVIGLVTYVLTYKKFTITGYILDLPQLWIIGTVMLMQAIILDRRNLLVGSVGLIMALIHPVFQIIVHGQRGDMIRLAILATVPYLAARRRPTRATILVSGAALAVLLTTLATSRGLILTGQASNRFDAVYQLGTVFFKDSDRKLEGSEEWIYGPAAVKTAWSSGKFGYGRVFLVALPLRFLPKEFFPWKYEYYYNHVSFDRVEVPSHTGVHIPWGAAPTGIAEGYVEFWWFFPAFWGVLGYIHQKIYSRACQPDNGQAHCFNVAFTIALSYLVTQEMLFATMNFIYSAAPAFLVYRYCRRPSGELRTFPVIAGDAQA